MNVNVFIPLSKVEVQNLDSQGEKKNLFKASPVAYGISLARGQIRAATLVHSHATPNPSRICHLCGNLQHRGILNPLRKARDQTCILTDTMSFS